MVKPESCLRQQHENEANSSTFKFRGVRKRKWGKYVSEIRLSNSRKRIWLGSFDTAEKAARAFDAALYCLRGSSAKFNFPHDLPEIFNARSLTPEEIRVEAARFANSYSGLGLAENSEHEQSSSISFSEFRVDSPRAISDGNCKMTKISLDTEFSDSIWTSTEIHFEHARLIDSCSCLAPVATSEQEPSFSISSSDLLHVDSPSLSVSGGELPEIPLDTEFLNSFLTLGSTSNIINNLGGYEIFQGYDDLCFPEIASSDYYGNDNSDFFTPEEGSSFLWNF